ncbi:hypothetical protein AX774_g1714 [Zancudomyces culisetae]|uniref:Uncharacterized protein n=1 Tax=Zancudomyces culisetae TaxID=1213189 RepID=A0A1R1PUX2_ZANCU|nr:hypothetical protein AX774_g3120 [Zancudomyces culisetae]OMH84750.1 hypothetical protein AX774_g1714 [Zancudomyces culisetae]|eukprot:OMH83377.1 hypothetical protein AX774_g3120 [Zancudomyces culisetae]
MTVAIDRTGKEKLIIASHFLPTFVKVKGRDGNGCGFQFENRRDHAALYEGIRSLKKIAKEKYSEYITVGHLGTILEEDKSEKNVSTLDASDITKLKQELWSNERQVPVLLDQADAYNHYEGYCKKGIV